MRIIKEGCIKPSEYIAKCKKCGCEFGFTLDDIEVKAPSQYDCPSDKNTYSMFCPYCQTPMLVVWGGTKALFLAEFMNEYARDKESWRRQ